MMMEYSYVFAPVARKLIAAGTHTVVGGVWCDERRALELGLRDKRGISKNQCNIGACDSGTCPAMACQMVKGNPNFDGTTRDLLFKEAET